MRTTGMRWERVMAWTIVTIVHVVLTMLLLRMPAPLRGNGEAESALDVVWMPRMRSHPASGRQHTASPSIKRRHTSAIPSSRIPVPIAAEAAAGEAIGTMRAKFLEQVRLPESGASDVPADPFANRIARLPGRDARTFRMRPPPSLAERVAAVGRMFGGGDDPCRSARDSINELSQAGDSRVLQDALDYEKRHCR